MVIIVNKFQPKLTNANTFQQNWVQKIFGPKKFGVYKKLGLKNVGSKKILGPKKMLRPKKMLGSKKILGPNNLGQQNFWSKKFLVQKIFVGWQLECLDKDIPYMFTMISLALKTKITWVVGWVGGWLVRIRFYSISAQHDWDLGWAWQYFSRGALGHTVLG